MQDWLELLQEACKDYGFHYLESHSQPKVTSGGLIIGPKPKGPASFTRYMHEIGTGLISRHYSHKVPSSVFFSGLKKSDDIALQLYRYYTGEDPPESVHKWRSKWEAQHERYRKYVGPQEELPHLPITTFMTSHQHSRPSKRS